MIGDYIIRPVETSTRFVFLTNISRIFDLMKLSFCGRSSKSAVFHYIAVSCFSAFLFASRPREWNRLSRKTRRSEKYCNFIKTSNRLGERVHAERCEQWTACMRMRKRWNMRWQRAREVWKQFNSIDLRRALQRLIEEKSPVERMSKRHRRKKNLIEKREASFNCPRTSQHRTIRASWDFDRLCLNG